MEMLVRILGVGSEWWVRPGPDRSDPLRFTKHAAYFNTTAFPHGSKFRRSWKVPGVLRFNGNSRIDPHRPKEVLGCIFGCVGITQHGRAKPAAGHRQALWRYYTDALPGFR